MVCVGLGVSTGQDSDVLWAIGGLCVCDVRYVIDQRPRSTPHPIIWSVSVQDCYDLCAVIHPDQLWQLRPQRL